MILKYSEPVEIVKRSIDSVKKYVDDIFITVTYNDEIPPKESPLIKLLNSYNAHITYFKWVDDFSVARQFALEQTPHGTDCYIYWQDADDVLMHPDKLREIADEAFENQFAAIYFDYWYQVELDEDGNVREIIVQHKRERIIRNDNTWKWVGSLHETLIEQKQENLMRYGRPECVVVHLTDGKRMDENIERNIKILEATAEREKHKDPRTIMYLAKAYFDKAKMTTDAERNNYSSLAMELFREYLEGSGVAGSEDYIAPSGWKEERSTAWGFIADISIMGGNPKMAIEAYKNAIDEAPWFPNYYVDRALAHIMLNEFKEAKQWLNVGLNTPTPETTIVVTPRDLKAHALEALFQIHIHENKFDLAEKDAEKLVKLMPEHKKITDRYLGIKSLNQYNKACQSAVFLGKYLEAVNEKDKIPLLINSFSSDMQKEKFASEMRHLFIPPRKWEDNEIAILCGPGAEEWSPVSLESGIGGSEEAVIRISEELVKLGWKVSVYGNPGTHAGEYNGVNYHPWYEINPKDEFNTLILWRSIGFVDVSPKSKFTMLWLHDVPNNPDFTEERIAKIDKIAVLSEYHKSILRMQKNGEFFPVPEDKVFLTANGIPEMLQKTWNGDPHRLIYMSSPDRGLVYLLKMWPAIKSAVHDASLHIFYGFHVYDVLYGDNPARLKWKQQIMEMMNQDGIEYHGRVGHPKLHEEINKSGIWAYPTDFTEISCISAMKAQSLGAIPVTTNLAALEETVKNGVKVDVDIRTKKGQEEYQKALIDLMQDEAKQKDIREQMITWAQDYFQWKNVAAAWDVLFRIKNQSPEKRMELISGGD